ncbi:hypothetical protein [Neotamlana laminarinivorans]|uniref:Right handed beta helix region n=1 Tax=Neotamlana laminarinivorans TaxID=2883124 RepID=A0A9X1I488_9FLAO|nr:hypothetical protein [Tamlana laminarinivorans]MCB4800137.1 hypothetical protein [Tamlana laminarinivorans]
MRFIYFFLTFCFVLLWSSCRKDFEFTTSTGSLQFSKDTVYLDTVFTNIGSSTYNLKVYNNSNEDILIPSVKLGLGETSNYRLNVDGISGKIFENVELLAKDSLYIFIETTINYSEFANTESSYLYTDQIQFDSNTNLQTVELVTLVQDAVFIYPDRDETTKVIETLTLNIGDEIVETDLQGRELLADELTFTNEKPYVIYGFATVPENETLTINPGARVYFHADSGIIVSNGASIQINGEYSNDQELLENEVIFEGDRLEPKYTDTPGQWGTIWLLDGSINNQINYLTIKNATIGILSDGNPTETNNKLSISNSQIYNCSSFGLYGRNTSIEAKNLVINNSGLSSFAGTIGGKYNFTHSTLVNYWNSSFRQYPAILLNNFVLDEDGNAAIASLTEANFNNCIIYGNDNPEFLIEEIEDDTTDFNFKFTNCLIRFSDTNNNYTGDNYNFDDVTHYENIIFNENPDFKDTVNNKLIIGENSEAINKGSTIFSNQVTTDILNKDRTTSPDLGAYQHITFTEDD